MVFGAIAGGMFVRLGRTVGAVFTLSAEVLLARARPDIHGLDTTLYGLMLVLFILSCRNASSARQPKPGTGARRAATAAA